MTRKLVDGDDVPVESVEGASDPADASIEEFRKYNNRSVERVISILNVLQESSEGLTLGQINSGVGLAKASAFRYLWTLERHRYVERDAVGRYRLGLGFVGMQSRHLEVLRERAWPWLQRLRDETGETASLGILDGDAVRYVDTVESGRGVRMARAGGVCEPVHCTALGKAILAGLAPGRVRGIVSRAGMATVTANTITSADDLLDELAKVTRRGYAVDDGESDIDGRAVAVPIPGTRLPAALAITAPASRLPLNDVDNIAKTLTHTAERIVTDPVT